MVISVKTIQALALIALCFPALSFACSSDLECQFGAKCSKQELDQIGICTGGNRHNHDDKKHRQQIILDSHEFASKTCSYDANCDPGFRCDLRPGFHKGMCIRRR